MPTVDQYTSQAQLTTAHAAPQVSPADAASAASEGIRQTDKAVRTFGDVMKNVVDFQETTQAHNIANEKLKDIQLRAAADPDLKAYDRYKTEIDKVGSDAASTISSGDARMQFQAEHANTASQINLGVQKGFWEKQLKAAHADTMKYVEDKKAEYWANPVDALKKQTLGEINGKIDALQASQAIDAEQAMKWKMEIQKDLPYGQAVQDAGLDPARTAELIKQGYYNIEDPTKKATVLKYAEAMAKNNEIQARQEQTDLQDKTETNIFLQMQKAHDPTSGVQAPTPIDIENAFKSGDLSPEGTRRLTLMLNKPVVQTGSAEVYIQYLDKVYSPNMKAGSYAKDLRTKIMEDPNLTPKQKAHLIEGNLIKIDGAGKGSLSLLAAQPDAGPGFMATAWNFIKGMFSNHEHATDVMDQLQEQVKSGQISQEQLLEAAKKLSSNKALQVNPSITSAKKGGQIMADRYGNKAIVYPDGNYEAIDNTDEQDPNPDEQGAME
jgi:hypothetical protein